MGHEVSRRQHGLHHGVAAVAYTDAAARSRQFGPRIAAGGRSQCQAVSHVHPRQHPAERQYCRDLACHLFAQREKAVTLQLPDLVAGGADLTVKLCQSLGRKTFSTDQGLPAHEMARNPGRLALG